jgi:hypothetical protein
MTPIRLYTTLPTALTLATLGIRGELRRRVQLLPFSALPAPLPTRLVSLRVERDALRRDLAIARWHLELFREGYYLPDAGREQGLQADIEALATRLRAVVATLQAQGARG